MTNQTHRYPRCRDSTPAMIHRSVPRGHSLRTDLAPPLDRLRQLTALPALLSRPPQRRLRISRHRVHLSPRHNRAIRRPDRQLNRRITTLTQHPAQRAPHPMRPPRNLPIGAPLRNTKSRPLLLNRERTPHSQTQRKPGLPARRIPRHQSLPAGNRRGISTDQPTQRGALPTGLHTTGDLLQPHRHLPILGNVIHRRHHPGRDHLTPRLPRHTSEYAHQPRQPARPKAGASGGRGTAPNPGTTSESGGRSPAWLAPHGADKPCQTTGHSAQGKPPLHSGPTARQPPRGAARKQPPTPAV